VALSIAASLATELFGEAHGYAIERVYDNGRPIGVRLARTNAADPPRP
jgi:hypothetical protein